MNKKKQIKINATKELQKSSLEFMLNHVRFSRIENLRFKEDEEKNSICPFCDKKHHDKYHDCYGIYDPSARVKLEKILNKQPT